MGQRFGQGKRSIGVVMMREALEAALSETSREAKKRAATAETEKEREDLLKLATDTRAES